jgi:hypothetical protein
MSYIKLPLNGTTNPLQDYIVCNVDGVYELELSGSDVIHLYYTSPASTGDDYLRVSITYDGTVVEADVVSLRKLIAQVNQQEGNVPTFNLLSEAKVKTGDKGEGVLAKSANPA